MTAPHDPFDRPGMTPLARRLLHRVDSEEPLEGVIVDVVNSLDQLAAHELAELLTAIGKRHRRDRGSGPVPPDSVGRQR